MEEYWAWRSRHIYYNRYIDTPKPIYQNLLKLVQDKGWYSAAERYNNFIQNHKNLQVLFLELGIEANTPAIIKYPFWNMTKENPKAIYACINYGAVFIATAPSFTD